MSNSSNTTTNPCSLSSSSAEDDLWTMLTSDQVRSIDCSLFINASPRDTTLPALVNTEATSLLQKLTGRIYPIALRGKSQAGKSTTLNRLAQISNFPLTKGLLNVAKNFGSTTTYGIWIMIIQFKNNDTLLLFDTQGTDRGADEITHKLIAFTDHVCTKVVDVFRMPTEGFSNDYINAHYCLALGRESVQNLKPTSDKTIMWTNSVLPKQSPFDYEKSCHTPEEYHAEMLRCVVGERIVQAIKAEKYTEGTPIITTSQPPHEILLQISELNNTHPFIQNELLPAMQKIVYNVQPVTFGGHVITGGCDYVEYLNNIYKNIQTSVIDLSFCARPLIRSIGMTTTYECMMWIKKQIEEMLTVNSSNLDWISNHLVREMNTKQSQCIEKFETEMVEFPKDSWQEQVNDLTTRIQTLLKTTIEKFKKPVLEKYVDCKYEELNQLCCDGLSIDQLQKKFESKTKNILQLVEADVPLLNGNMNDLDHTFIGQSLKIHQEKLCQTQRNVERDWFDREDEFKQSIYSTDPDGIDIAIREMLDNHRIYCQQQFAAYGIHPQYFFDETAKIQELKSENLVQSKTWAQKHRTECISEFNKKTGIIFSMPIAVPEKYGKLLNGVEACVQQYYNALPWPLNKDTIGEVELVLQQQLERALNQLYTPAIQERLKQDRIAQQQQLANQKLAENESLVWVHCVACKRVFAGRTRGCVNVTCSRFKVDQGLATDHGCNLTFQWAKAQPADLSLLPSEFWFSNVEAGNRASSARILIADFLTTARDSLNAPKALRKRRSSR